MGYIRKNIRSVVWVVLILAYVAAFSVINFCGFEQYCNADMYSDTLVTKFMWDQKSLFPEGWVFGNQFYVFVTPTVAALFYGLCGSINLATVLATTFLTILTILAFWWMLRPFADREQILAGMAVLMGAVVGPNIVWTDEGQIFYLMASHYAGYIITLFLVFGDYIRALKGHRTNWLVVGIAAVLSFCTGMQSLRQTAVMVLPLLVFEGIRVLSGLVCREEGVWRRASFVRVVIYTLSNFLGVAAIRLLDPPSISIYGDLSFNNAQQAAEGASTALRALRSITGLKYLSGDTPILGYIAAVLVAAAVLAVLMALFGRLRDGEQSLIMLLLCSLGCVSVIGIVVNLSTRSIYLFPWYPLAAVAAVLLQKRLRKWLKNAVFGLLALAMAVNLFVSYGADVKTAVAGPDPYQKTIAEYVVQKGYTRLYGGWNTTTAVAVWTDGAVDAGLWFGDVCAVLPYINAQAIYEETDNEKAVYLVHKDEEAAFQKRADALGADIALDKRFEGTPLALYTSDRQLMFLPEPTT